MRKSIKIFIIGIVLLGSFFAYMLWELKNMKNYMGLRVEIPEINAQYIRKSIYFPDSIKVESVLIQFTDSYQSQSHYTIVKFENIDKEISNLFTVEKYENYSSSSTDVFGVEVWNFQKPSQNSDFKYSYTNKPIQKKELGDSVLVMNFGNTDLEISLTKENKKDMEISLIMPATIVLYKKDKELYLLLARKLYEENSWIGEAEIKELPYYLVKNWGKYNKN